MRIVGEKQSVISCLTRQNSWEESAIFSYSLPSVRHRFITWPGNFGVSLLAVELDTASWRDRTWKENFLPAFSNFLLLQALASHISILTSPLLKCFSISHFSKWNISILEILLFVLSLLKQYLSFTLQTNHPFSYFSWFILLRFIYEQIMAL